MNGIIMKKEYSSQPWLEELSLVHFYHFFRPQGLNLQKRTPLESSLGSFQTLSTWKTIELTFFGLVKLSTKWPIWDQTTPSNLLKNMSMDLPKVSYTENLLSSSILLKNKEVLTNHGGGTIEGKWIKPLKNIMASFVATLEYGICSHLVL